VPIVENDPWRMQYFAGVACPEDVVIPTDDPDCYRLYPAHRWVYNKLLVCESQGLEHGPHGIAPPRFPVFSKPVYNLRGMGVGGRVITTAAEYARVQTPGHLWMPLLTGAHVSSDVAVVAGVPRWWRHTTGAALRDGTFDYWTVAAEPLPALEAYCGAWLHRHLKGYSGCMNLETIGGTIIEAHLRFADQWVDLTAPAGWRASSSSTRTVAGRSGTRSAGPAIASCSSAATASGGRSPPTRSRSCAACPGSRASRSRSIPTARRRRTPCRRAASGSRS
jgi:hypothetical protein